MTGSRRRNTVDIMVAIAALILTAINVAAIIIRRKRKLNIKSISFSQSNIHSVIKDLLPSNSDLREPIVSQASKHNKEKNIRVIYTPDQKAYWVVHNTFYCADLVDGQLDPNSGKPIDTEGLSKKEIEKLLFILDNLNG